ncbi:MAG: FkbM family methyltransferase [Saprospiraceae bacterium]|nr:FkbM family methyltransferase [Saprospiraceae bacterium]
MSFEPHPVTFSRLKENLELNKSHIQAHNLGLGDRRSKLKMYEIDSHNIGMNKMFKEEQIFPSVLVEVEPLDDFWRDNGRIDFIKIDVEGFEYSVLKGASSVLQKYSPILVIEIDDNNLRSNGATPKDLLELLISFKYDYIRTSDKKVILNPGMNFSNCHFDIVAMKSSSIVDI